MELESEGVLFPEPVATLGHIRGRGPRLAVGGTEQSLIAEGSGNNTPFDGCEADKFASTYCANALVFRWVNFDPMGDREPLYEAEHRRWMMTKLLMNLEHEGIVPYAELPQWKKENFVNLIDGVLDNAKKE